jgi:hypothetical protein
LSTDSYAPADYWHNCAGARNQLIVREEIMEDWGQRWLWLRETNVEGEWYGLRDKSL